VLRSIRIRSDAFRDVSARGFDAFFARYEALPDLGELNGPGGVRGPTLVDGPRIADFARRAGVPDALEDTAFRGGEKGHGVNIAKKRLGARCLINDARIVREEGL
jgi:hypothetical protein